MPVIETKGAMSSQGLGEFSKVTAANYIEDVFSTYLYTGTGATKTITNGINLSGKGGLVWTKDRVDGSFDHTLTDTARGPSYYINSNTVDSQSLNAGLTVNQFNNNGYQLGADGFGNSNRNGFSYVSWTFRKQAKFFDVVTYTGNGSTQAINHNLGSAPGCVIIKNCTTGSTDWQVWHRSTSSGNYLVLNTTAGQSNTNAINKFGNNTTTVDPTSTQFTVGSSSYVNENSSTFIAYLFAHNAGGFGLSGTDNVISCGVATTGLSTDAVVNLGYEPQWIMYKCSTSSGEWKIFDNMRGMPVGSNDAVLYANSSSSESSAFDFITPSATGFSILLSAENPNQSYIYIAIRRGPMKTPTSGTSVFSPVTVSPSGAAYSVNAGFPIDLSTIFPRIGGYASISYKWFADRLRGTDLTLTSTSTAAELSISGSVTGCFINSDNMTGISVNDTNGSWGGGAGQSLISYNLRRAPGFFDVVCFKVAGPATVNHNLGVVPELIIKKKRASGTGNWYVYSSTLGATKYLILNTTDGEQTASTIWNDTAPTSSVFSVGSSVSSSETNVAYLFASVAGVSKVGSYTGNGSSQTINCGFAAGSRFVMIKRTDSTGDWYVWDSARGIVAGNDPHLSLNTTAAEVTTDDSVDTDNSGFVVNQDAATNVNVNSASYIFLAIA